MSLETEAKPTGRHHRRDKSAAKAMNQYEYLLRLRVMARAVFSGE
jgi:hypothetical protein